MFKKFYTTQASLAGDFVDKVYGSGASMAEIQGYFMLHKHDANAAIKDAHFFAKAMSEKHKNSPFRQQAPKEQLNSAEERKRFHDLFDRGITHKQDHPVSNPEASTASYDYSDPAGIKKSRAAAASMAAKSPPASSGATKVKPIIMSDTSQAARDALASIHATNEAMRKSLPPDSR